MFACLLLIFSGMAGKVEWRNGKDIPFLVLTIWLLYCISSLFNPGSPGMEPWLITIRPHLYMIFTIPLFCILLKAEHVKTFLILWGVFSLIFSLKGFIQLQIGLDPPEKRDLAAMVSTHLIWGKLRVFSMCSDAGQFGVSQAYSAVLGLILFLSSKKARQKAFFLIVAAAGIYGMFISGTRGAVFVLFGGAFIYCLLVKKLKLLLLCLFFAGGFFCFMRFTHIGDGIYPIYRMRSAFNPTEDPSYMVRKNNQRVLKSYLASRPFGGGLGSMELGPRGSVLKSIPYDSGYVLIWGDTGVVGLCLYIGMFLFFMIKGTLAVWFKIKNEWFRGVLIAFIAGLGGLLIANYGNPVLLRPPLNVIMFLGIALIFVTPRLDKELAEMTPDTGIKTNKNNNTALVKNNPIPDRESLIRNDN
ncbi:MAG: O-antigen ligase family protein [Bacteroidales bacterium]|nr:O-antigen ligase family protein [Bacteroidales bacterium]